jgi:hypothetical protein
MVSKSAWVCQACGKHWFGKQDDGNDISCVLWAVECDPDSLEFDERGLVTKADAITRSDNE